MIWAKKTGLKINVPLRENRSPPRPLIETFCFCKIFLWNLKNRKLFIGLSSCRSCWWKRKSLHLSFCVSVFREQVNKRFFFKKCPASEISVTDFTPVTERLVIPAPIFSTCRAPSMHCLWYIRKLFYIHIYVFISDANKCFVMGIRISADNRSLVTIGAPQGKIRGGGRYWGVMIVDHWLLLGTTGQNKRGWYCGVMIVDQWLLLGHHRAKEEGGDTGG